MLYARLVDGNQFINGDYTIDIIENTNTNTHIAVSTTQHCGDLFQVDCMSDMS